MIINPYRHASAGAGNGFLNNLQEFWDLGADVDSDGGAGGNNSTNNGTTTGSGAPDGGGR